MNRTTKNRIMREVDKALRIYGSLERAEERLRRDREVMLKESTGADSLDMFILDKVIQEIADRRIGI